MQTNQPRRPGEVIFNAAVVAVSLFLFYTAYGISGFEALSGAGSVPMVTTGIMVVASVVILLQSLRKPPVISETVAHDILPLPVVAIVALILGYAVLLKPLGFIPTSFLFLVLAIRLLGRRSLIWSAGMAVVSVIGIYIVFRLVFTVLMPPGVVPEGEMLAFFRSLFSGGAR
jgi:putative tricarboxylic transport membrane protein